MSAPLVDLASPTTLRSRRFTAIAVIAMLAASVTCVALAPTLMPDSYSVVEHSISESAAQGIEGVWLARTGLLLFGFAVLVLAGSAGIRWGLPARVAHRTYGVSIIGAAAFAHMPWEEIPYDKFEDFLHSVASFGVGFSFIAGVLLVTFNRTGVARGARAFDWLAILASFVIPMIMFNVTGIAGLVQRIMFAIAYVWYGWEALRSTTVDRAIATAPPRP